MRLQGRTAIVTGGGSGIGRAVGLGYVREGARVVFADLNAEAAQASAEQARSQGGEALGLALDVRRQDSIEAALAETVRRFGGVDILLNAAGVIRSQPVLETTRDSFQAVLEVNLLGLFFMLQAAARRMVEQKGGGKIVNIASIAGRRGAGLALQYSASKAAVISVTQSAALALVEHGINVNAIAPGHTRTGMWADIEEHFAKGLLGAAPEAFTESVVQSVPAKRMGDPQDLVGAAVFLASAEADFVVGQTFNIDGGAVLS